MIRLFEYYGVPSACFDRRGRLVEVSSCGRDLLGASMEVVIRQAESLVAQLIVSAANREEGGGAALSQPTLDRRTTIRAQILPAPDQDTYAIALFLPRAAMNETMPVAAWGLSVRESEVAEEIGRGASTKEIAARLGISFHTARRHTERVFTKLGVQSRSQVVLALATLRRHDTGR
ncbi:MAG TPA: helix-turn-helix transcriptional regulator [Gemmatimonadaceae bacterium]